MSSSSPPLKRLRQTELYIKNYLRSTVGEERLNGLAHMYVNRDIELDYDSVIDEVGRENRRLKFV